MLSDLAKKVLYGSGLLGLYHRLRNRRTLCVVMFHRVLDPADPRWASADPDYTISTALFEACLGFFRRHYTIVSEADVLAARKGEASLPPHALLVTFDDGWADNLDFALPALARAQMPALLFVIHDVVGTRRPLFQEALVGAWRLGRQSVPQLAAAFGIDSAAADNSDAALRRLVARVEQLPARAREDALARLAPLLDDGQRHWLDAPGLRALEQGGVALGLHGKTHTPMTQVEDLDSELGGARERLAPLLASRAAPLTMSFPHGRYDARIAAQAHASGYELVFTSDQILNPAGPQPAWLLGRCGFEGATISDRNGRFRADLLALYLFRKPRRRLAA